MSWATRKSRFNLKQLYYAIRTVAFLLTAIITTTGFAETDPKFYAIQASAIVQAAPAQITLSWPADPNATGY
ncbi:MAG: hypothetical protein JWM99_239, partial [Verrucomicrobiales bacterium]|nr:hypothetical protein [Verrucomicrobiales bacterium]